MKILPCLILSFGLGLGFSGAVSAQPISTDVGPGPNSLSEVDGTFTPTDASGAGLTFSTATGFYRKIGHFVFVWGQINYPATASAVQAVVGSLPFTASNSGTNQVGSVQFLSGIGVNNAVFVVNKNNTTMSAANLSTNTAVNNVSFTGATVIYFGSYPTDQ